MEEIGQSSIIRRIVFHIFIYVVAIISIFLLLECFCISMASLLERLISWKV